MSDRGGPPDDATTVGTRPFRKQLGVAMKDRRPTRADARRNYDRLIVTARAAFLEHGADAPLDEIAKRAGVGSATLYRHFPTRDDLLAAVLRDWIDGLLASAQELAGHPSPGEALGIWLRAYLADAPIPRGMSGVFIKATAVPATAAASSPSGGLAVSWTAIREAVERLLVRAQATGSISTDIDAQELLRLVDAIGVAAERAADPAENATRMLAIVMRGLRTPADSPAVS